MTDTPNSRLARVLRILADVAGEFPENMPPRVMDEIVEALIGLDALDLDKAEKDATEAARLAGISADGWTLVSERLPEELEFVLITTLEGYVTAAQFSEGHFYLNGGILSPWKVTAHRPLPAPYRPEETTDG